MLTENCEYVVGPHRIILGDSSDVLDTIPDSSVRLVITSPPYNMKMEYERDTKLSLEDYIAELEPIIHKTVRKISDDGHLCWQVGSYVNKGEVFPLDFYFYDILRSAGLKLRNRIIWHFNFGRHATKRFSGRYETLLWFSKSDNYVFNLEPVLVPQLYPGKRHGKSKGDKAGMPSGNPKGKNPSDFWTYSPTDAFLTDNVWEIPNVKANHPEKTTHPAQFPSELVERCILALTKPNDIVLDPFVGAGTTVIAADKHERVGLGVERHKPYADVAVRRLEDQRSGLQVTRQFGRAVRQPKPGEGVATIPVEWIGAAAE